MEEENEVVEEETTEEETSNELDEELLDEESEDSTDEEESEDSKDTIDWKARAMKAEEAIQRAKKKGKKPTNLNTKAKKSEDDNGTSDRLSKLEKSEEKRQFGHEQGLTPEETDQVFKYNPKPTADTLKDPFIKAGLEAIRRSKRVDDNTVSSSPKSKIFKTKKFKEMSADEKNVAYQKHLQSLVASKK